MKKILLIEDDPFLIDIYTTKLKREGFSTSVANDGKIGLEKIREDKPDLVILDIVLPNADGWEILSEIKNDEQIKSVKVVILSSLGQKDEVEKGLRLGAVKYLVKAHYTPSEVVREIKKIFEASTDL